MTKLYVTEYSSYQVLFNGQVVQIPLEPAITTQVVDFTSGAAVSGAFNAATSIVRLDADAVCSILFSAAGTNATTSNQRLDAGEPEFKGVAAGAGLKVSAISNT